MTPPRTLSKALTQLKTAQCPETIFGSDPTTIDTVYRAWAKVCHEDLYTKKADKTAAHEAFLLLTKWLQDAERKVARGTYGDNKPSVLAILRTKTAAYEVTALCRADGISDWYDGTVVSDGTPCTVRYIRSPRNNDLAKTEADVLAELPSKLDPKHTAYFPTLLDSFEVTQDRIKRRANVFRYIDGAVSLADIRVAYPKGVNVKDAAWMFNRLLEALHLLHCQGVIHANLTPASFYVVPATHQGFLTDFCYSVKDGGVAKAIVPAWQPFYPSEVTEKRPLNSSTDMYMAAATMSFLLGGKVGKVPAGTPAAIGALLHACWLGQLHRTSSAKELYSDFKAVRNGLGWKKEFRPFSLTATP